LLRQAVALADAKGIKLPAAMKEVLEHGRSTEPAQAQPAAKPGDTALMTEARALSKSTGVSFARAMSDLAASDPQAYAQHRAELASMPSRPEPDRPAARTTPRDTASMLQAKELAQREGITFAAAMSKLAEQPGWYEWHLQQMRGAR
jgi:hypothetical protein